MLKRREFVTVGLLGALFELRDKPAMAEAPASSINDIPSDVNDVKTLKPEAVKKVLQSCVGMAFDDMKKHQQQYGSFQKGSVQCSVGNEGKSAQIRIGRSVQLYIDLSIDGREPQIGFVTPAQGGQVVPFKPETMQTLADVVRTELKAKQPAAAPGWD